MFDNNTNSSHLSFIRLTLTDDATLNGPIYDSTEHPDGLDIYSVQGFEIDIDNAGINIIAPFKEMHLILSTKLQMS